MKKIEGYFFYSGKAKAHEALLIPFEERVDIEIEEKNFTRNRKEFYVQALMADCPLVIEFSNGDRFESKNTKLYVEDYQVILKRHSKLLQTLESKKKFIALATAMLILFLYFFINYGGAFIGRNISSNIPLNLASKLDAPIIKSLDKAYLKPSKLSAERQLELREYFKRHSKLKLKILFRSGGQLGANAFALAGKTVIFTDEIVNLLGEKKYLLPIFLHETAHLEKRHVVSTILSTTVFNSLTFFIIGDMSGVTESLANITFTLSGLKHSRSFETEADLYASGKLIEYDISLDCFEKGMNLLQESQKKKLKVSEIFLTHPNTKKRMDTVKRAYPNSKEECEL